MQYYMILCNLMILIELYGLSVITSLNYIKFHHIIMYYLVLYYFFSFVCSGK